MNNKYKTSLQLYSPVKIMEIDDIVNVWSMLELSDYRIAVGGDWTDGRIRIYSVNFELKSWNKDIEHKAHNEGIPSLCELDGYRLVSVSHDATIKIWELSETTIFLLKTLFLQRIQMT